MFVGMVKGFGNVVVVVLLVAGFVPKYGVICERAFGEVGEGLRWEQEIVGV